MKLHLTDLIISQLSIPSGRSRFTVSDAMCPGLSLELRAPLSGTWRYRFSTNRIQKCLSLGLLRDVTLAKAREKYFLAKSQIESGGTLEVLQSGGRISQCPTLAKFVEDRYLPHIRSYKRCVWADETLLNNHLLPTFGRLRLNAVSESDIALFLQNKIKDGYKQSYCNRFLVLLGFIFNLALKWDTPGVTRNPVKRVPRFKVINHGERFLEEEEAIRLMESIRGSSNQLLQYFVPLALLTGARKRELLDAKWSDFDLERKLWIIPMTKSGRPRHVPLIDEAITILGKLKAFLPSILLQSSFLENPWILPNPKTGRPFNSIFHSWDSARKAANLSDVRIHDLRHSFASALVNRGVPIYDVQKLLGHQNIRTTERYAHLAPERLRASASLAGECYGASLNEPVLEN